MDEMVKTKFEDFEKRLLNAERRYEDITKTRFDDLDKRILSSDKRIDDVKWFVGTITGIFAIVFALNAYIGNLNFSSERDSLRIFQEKTEREVKEKLGNNLGVPFVELLASDKMVLANQEIVAEIVENGADIRLFLKFFIKNSGSGGSGKLYIKIYTSGPIILPSRSADEVNFEYEVSHTPESMSPNEIPGGFSFESTLWTRLNNKSRPPVGKYKALAKVYFGNGKSSSFPFVLVVPSK